MKIRPEIESDRNTVYAINVAAFESNEEADLVDRLRDQAGFFISLVAEQGGEIVGHIMLSPASLPANPDTPAIGLGPMAVTPANQGQGIGSALVRAGLEQCRQQGFQAAFVLGHPDYYPRFGFVPASRFGIESVYDVPDEVFMAMELLPSSLTNKAGKMYYHPIFDEL